MPHSIGRHRDGWLLLVIVGCLAGLFAAIAPTFVNQYRIPVRSAAGIYFCFLLLLLLTIAPGLHGIRLWIETRVLVRKKSVVLLMIWCLPYLVYAWGTGDFRWTALIRLLAVAAPLLVLYGLFPVTDWCRFAWQDLGVSLWFIAVVLSHQLNGIWNVPVNLDFLGRLFLISVGSWCWIWVRRVPDLGYEFSGVAKSLRVAAWQFGLFAVIAIPAGWALQFTAWHPRWRGMEAFGVAYVEIFLFVAWLEELFFRGFLQSLLSNNLKSTRSALILVSGVFGLFHILHAPVPNWRYVVLATIAGCFYGSAFLKGGNLLAPALTHALVDTVWRTFFWKH